MNDWWMMNLRYSVHVFMDTGWYGLIFRAAVLQPVIVAFLSYILRDKNDVQIPDDFLNN